MSFPLLDSSLRNYIFIPLTIITICVSLLMKYLNTLFNKGKKPELHSETKSLDDWIREAAECNLDYGNYRAQIELFGKTFEELKA